MERQDDAHATEAFRRTRDHLLAHRDDLDAAVRGHAAVALPEHFNWAFDWFDTVASGDAGTALIVVDESSSETVSYAELATASSRTASWLRSLGIGPGDRVILMLDNRVELWELLLAGIRLGAVLVPCSTALGAEDLRDRIRRVGAAAAACDAAQVTKLDALAPDEARGLVRIAVAPGEAGCPAGWEDHRDARAAGEFRRERRTRADELLFLYFTSGTTSRPKIVAHTHSSYPAGHLSGMYWNGLRPGDRHLNLSAPGWAKHAWSSVFAPFAAEATVVALTPPAPTPELVLSALAEHRVDSFCAPPTVWRALVQEDLAAHRVALREATSAGEPLSAEIIARVRQAWRVRVREGYGQTETTAQIGIAPGVSAPEGSMGRTLPGYTIALLDPDSGEPGRYGEIAVAASPPPVGLAAGYLDDAGTATPLVQDGWYRTGDLAEADAEGNFFYLGRSDDVFKSASHLVSPFEVESALLGHPAVGQAAVVAFPDPQLTAVVKAFVALVAGATPDAATALDIARHAAAALPAHAAPRRIEFCALPLTATGKIRRAELRRRDAGREGNGPREGEFVVPAAAGEAAAITL